MADLPKFHDYLGPILDLLGDGAERTGRQVTDEVAARMGLTPEQLSETIPSGMSRAHNRIQWGLTYLWQAGCVERPRRAVYRITDRGLSLRKSVTGHLGLRDLEQFPEYREFKQRGGSRSVDAHRHTEDVQLLTPVEQVQAAVLELDTVVASDLVHRIRSMPPVFMEKAVLQLLVAMGYGGSAGAAQHLGGPGDGGFDGVINQDKLGLERIYVQAKRYQSETAVGRPEVQAFLGALHAAGAAGGVFITTSRFTPDASHFAKDIKPRVILIDGALLGSLMVTHGVGVHATQEFRIVEVDADFFEE